MKNYWSDCRERLLSESYGEEIRRTMVSRWKVRKTAKLIEFQDWKDPETKIIDRGGQIEAESGNAKEIHGMLDLARVKGWKTVEWTGNDEFLRDAFLESIRAGICVKLADENQRRIWNEVRSEIDRRNKEKSKVKEHAPKP